MSSSPISYANFALSRQAFDGVFAKVVIPESSYYVASFARAASEESLEGQSFFWTRVCTAGWIAIATLCSLGSVFQNILEAPINLIGRLFQLSPLEGIIEFFTSLIHAIQNLFFVALSPFLLLCAVIYPKGTIGPLFTGKAWESEALHIHDEYKMNQEGDVHAKWQNVMKEPKHFADAIELFAQFKNEATSLSAEKKEKLEALQKQLQSIASKKEPSFRMHFFVDGEKQSKVFSMTDQKDLLLFEECLSQAALSNDPNALMKIEIQSNPQKQKMFVTEIHREMNPFALQVNKSHEGKFFIPLQVMLTKIFYPDAKPFALERPTIFNLQDDLRDKWPKLQEELKQEITDHLVHLKAEHPKVVFLKKLLKTLTSFVSGVQQNPTAGYQNGILLLGETIEAMKMWEADVSSSSSENASLLQSDRFGSPSKSAKEIVQELCMARFAYVSLHDYKYRQIKMVYGDIPEISFEGFFEIFSKVNAALFKRYPAQAKSRIAWAVQNISGTCGLYFHPLAQVASPYVHAVLERGDGKKTLLLQHATPTIQEGAIDLYKHTAKISPVYEHWIEICNERGQNILSVILENNFGVEGIRQKERMELANRQSNFYALTLPLDGAFFNGYTKGMTWSAFKTAVLNAFKEKKSGVELSTKVQNLLPSSQIDFLLGQTKNLFFADKSTIDNSGEYRALLALFYIHLIEHLETFLHFDFLHIGCKDDIDRGPVMKAILALYHVLKNNEAKPKDQESNQNLSKFLKGTLYEFLGGGWIVKNQGVYPHRAKLLEETHQLLVKNCSSIQEKFSSLSKSSSSTGKSMWHPIGILVDAPYFDYPPAGLHQGSSLRQTERRFTDALRFTKDPSGWTYSTNTSLEHLYNGDLQNLKDQFHEDFHRIWSSYPQLYVNDELISQDKIAELIEISSTNPSDLIHEYLKLFYPDRNPDEKLKSEELQLLIMSTQTIEAYYTKLLNVQYQSINNNADVLSPSPSKEKILSEKLVPGSSQPRQQVRVTLANPIQIEILGITATLRSPPNNDDQKRIHFPVHIAIEGEEATFVIVPEFSK